MSEANLGPGRDGPPGDPENEGEGGSNSNIPRRIQITLDVETYTMLQELLRAVQEYSEPHVVPAEICRAALRVVFRAHAHVCYDKVGKRGQWGTSRPNEFVEELVCAYQDGLRSLSSERLQRDWRGGSLRAGGSLRPPEHGPLRPPEQEGEQQ